MHQVTNSSGGWVKVVTNTYRNLRDLMLLSTWGAPEDLGLGSVELESYTASTVQHRRYRHALLLLLDAWFRTRAIDIMAMCCRVISPSFFIFAVLVVWYIRIVDLTRRCKLLSFCLLPMIGVSDRWICSIIRHSRRFSSWSSECSCGLWML